MPPRLPLRSIQLAFRPHVNSPPSFLLPFLHQQGRNASILTSLSDTPEAYSKRIRRGRGPSSGKGKTSGRGHKGQKQHGKVPAHFNGGQTSEEVFHGERGFENRMALEISKVNLDRIQDWIDQGRIDPSQPITVKELTATRAIHGCKDGVKLLARGATALTSPINIVVSRASAAAIAAVEAAGGTVTTRYYTRYAIKRIRQGKTDPFVSMKWEGGQLGMGADPQQRIKGNGFQYRLPDPTSRKDMEYYRDPAHRGYLSYLVKEGEGPSLFFKPPQPGKEKAAKDKQQTKTAANRVW